MAAHRYWRFTCTDAGRIWIDELELRIVGGGADVTLPSGTITGAPSSPENAFDDTTAIWSTNDAQNDFWVTYDFGAGNEKDVVEFALTTGGGNLPANFKLDYSDDNSSWTNAATYSAQSLAASTQYIYSFAVSPSGQSVIGLRHNPSAFGQSVIGLRHNPSAFGQSVLGLQHIPSDPSGASILYVRHLPKVIAKTSLSVQHIASKPSGVSSLAVRHGLIATGASSVPIVHRPNALVLGTFWRLVVMLDGVDISTSVTGTVDIEASAGAARLADFVMQPAAGVIDNQAWVKKPVTIDYLTYSGGVLQTQHRRFTGFVTDAAFDPITKLTSFECSDLLQESFEGIGRDFIDGVIGGYYSESIFNETESGWEYAQQRLESQSYYYDKDVAGAGRKWPKLAGATDSTKDVANILDGSITISQARARDIINTVEIEFNYRVPRKWQREISFGWVFPQSFSDWLGQSQIRMPNKSMFLNALGSSWWVKNVSFSEPPPSGEINGANWVSHPEYELILSAHATVATRWNQDVTEKYTITVKADASIAKFGEIKETERYSIDAPDEEEHEQSVSNNAVISSGATGSSNEYQSPPAGSTALGNGDYYLDGASRAGFDNGIQTAIALARVDILDSHHKNEVACDVLVDPLLDIGQSVDVSTSNGGKGVLVGLDERYSFDDGSAISSLAINIYAPNVAGQSDDAVAVPSQADVSPSIESPMIDLQNYVGGVKTSIDPINPLNTLIVDYATDPVNTAWRGLLTNYTTKTPPPPGTQFYPFEFRIEMPEVEATLRDSQEFSSDITLDVAIPQESLTITG